MTTLAPCWANKTADTFPNPFGEAAPEMKTIRPSPVEALSIRFPTTAAWG